MPNMSATYGINAMGDGTAARQGVPLGQGAHHDEPLAAGAEHPKPDGGSVTEGNHSEIGHDKTYSPADTLGKGDDDDDDSEMVRRTSIVQALARTYSHASGAQPGGNGNPFFADENSPLNPSSPNFSAHEWAKAIVHLTRQEGSGSRSAGVCFQNLNVYGFGEASDYQKDVANVWMSMASHAKNTIFKNHQRIDILRQFDGVVHTGEMLVVLGPPGAGCSTTLKTIAGETNGLYIDEGSYFNYQGKSSVACLP